MFYFFLVVLLTFFSDFFIYGLFNKMIFFFLRTLLYSELFLTCNVFRISIISFFLLMESFFYSAYCGIDLIVILPLFFLISKYKKLININLFIISVLVVFALLFHYFIIDYLIFLKPLHILNLKNLIIHFIIVIIMIKYLLEGSLGNRSKRFI